MIRSARSATLVRLSFAGVRRVMIFVHLLESRRSIEGTLMY